MKHLLYLALDLCVILGPLFASFDRHLRFVRFWRPAAIAHLCVLIPFVIWDHFFTVWGVWSFSPHYTLGVTLFSLPLEEILFFIAIPFACVFLYELLGMWQGIEKTCGKLLSLLPILLAALAVFCGVFGGTYSRWVSVLALLGLAVQTKSRWSQQFWAMYLLHLVPFALVNGILTALPVVLYSDFGITGYRLGTIPIEDLLYSYVLIGANVAVYEKAKCALAPRSGSI